jgi:membrane associated rhomboid family serine protease
VSGPDLFVVCGKCQSEVSPYITECPYCGNRLRKRAPKIERHGEEVRAKEPRRMPKPGRAPKAPKPPKAPRQRRTISVPTGGGGFGGRPWATITLVVLSLAGYVTLAFVTRGEIALRALDSEAWRLATSTFVYDSAWYQLACLLAIGVFGWRLELRHGPLLVLVLFLLAGPGANAVATVAGDELLLGAPGAALAFAVAWAIPDIRRERAGVEHDGDLLGTTVLAVVVSAMPIATPYASAIAVALA